MNDLLILWLSLSLSGSLVTVTLLILKPVFRGFGKTWQYYIWLLVICRLLIPISPQVSIIGGLFQQAETYKSQQNTQIADPLHIIYGDIVQVPKAPDIKKQSPQEQLSADFYFPSMEDHVWGALWLLTASILLVRKVYGYVQFVKIIKRESKIITEGRIPSILQKVSAQMGIKKKTSAAVNSLVLAPMLLGVRKPVIILPTLAVSETELTYIFRHELTHYRRKDIFYKWVTEIAVCLHWFNPVVYLLRKQINQDCEFSCDENVISRIEEKDRKSYGDTLLNTIVVKSPTKTNLVTLSLNADGKLIKERLSAIMKYKQKSKRIVFTAAVLTAALSCGSFFSGAYTVSAADNKNTLEQNKTQEQNKTREQKKTTEKKKTDDAGPIRISNIDLAAGGKVSLGSKKLLSGTQCSAVFTWNGSDELTAICTSSNGTQNSYLVENGKETSFQIDTDGEYTIAVKNETANEVKGVNGSISFSQQTLAEKPHNTQATAQSDVSHQTVVYSSVEMRRYEGADGHPYVHDIKVNETTKKIVGYQYGMLAFDKDGNPLAIEWWSLDPEAESTYFYLDETSAEISPAETYDVRGGWSLNLLGTDLSVKQIAYVLYCDKEITFEDGTVWTNPDFDSWRATYEGKEVDVSILNSYYPYEQKITF